MSESLPTPPAGKLQPSFGRGTAVAGIGDLLAQADKCGTADGFARLIVLAKIGHRLGIELPKHRAGGIHVGAAMASVTSLTGFVGQNMAELGGFRRPLTQNQLSSLFRHYNTLVGSATDAPEIVLPA